MEKFFKVLIGFIILSLVIGLPVYLIFELYDIDKDTFWFLYFVGFIAFIIKIDWGEEKK